MNKLAAGRFLAAGFCMWGAALWIQGGFRALREDKDREREIWHKAEVESRDEHNGRSAASSGSAASDSGDNRSPIPSVMINGVPER